MAPLEPKALKLTGDVPPTEVMADAILEIGKAVRAITAGRLSRRALVVLVADQTGLPKRTINAVFDALEALETEWLK